jgi:YD repeat-containing protein
MASGTGTAGDAFLAIDPQGTKYQFNWSHAYRNARITKPFGMGPMQRMTEVLVAPAGQGVPGYGAALQRDEVWIYPTRIEDRFGNWVTFTWNAASDRLERIDAKDGRFLDLVYDANGRVITVTDGTRTWSYIYSSDARTLSQVALPDNTRWTYDLAGLRFLHAISDAEPSSCGAPPSKPNQTSRSGTIRHPSGAVGTFTFKPTGHGRSYVLRDCRGVFTNGSFIFYAVYPDLFDDLAADELNAFLRARRARERPVEAQRRMG